MKTTKTILTAILLCFFAFANAQQKKELTKEETLKYFNDTYHKLGHSFDTKFTLDKTVLVYTLFDGSTFSYDLMRNEPLEIVYCELCLTKYRVFFESDMVFNDYVFKVDVKSDAEGLKNALERLIKLVKDEMKTDSFAN